MQLWKLECASQARINLPLLEPLRLRHRQSSVLPTPTPPQPSINVQSGPSSSAKTSNSWSPARNHQTTGAKLIFTGRPQQGAQVLEAKRAPGSCSSGSLPLAPKPQGLASQVVVVVVIVGLVAVSLVAPSEALTELAPARSTTRQLPSSSSFASLPRLQIDGRRLVEMLGTNLIQNLAGLHERNTLVNRWSAAVPGLSFTSAHHHHHHHRNTPASSDRAPPQQTPLLARRPGRLMQALNKLSRRIGARNSIRFHNAVRDLAWQLLARVSMPTPIIYELRRRHLYSPEEDQWNDSLATKNTSMTIRSRRQLDSSSSSAGLIESEKHPRPVSRVDDEDEEDSDK